jgi:Trk K+ transport system NAD-binding subunit
MEQLRVSPDSPFASRKLRDLVPPESRVIVLAISNPDGSMTFNPPADAEVSGGDVVIVMGEQPSLRSLESILSNALG